jgi:hypothetical protein
MAIYAVIDNEIVSNVIVADSAKFADMCVKASNPNLFCVSLEDNPLNVAIGWGYVKNEFVEPLDPNKPKPQPQE